MRKRLEGIGLIPVGIGIATEAVWRQRRLAIWIRKELQVAGDRSNVADGSNEGVTDPVLDGQVVLLAVGVCGLDLRRREAWVDLVT